MNTSLPPRRRALAAALTCFLASGSAWASEKEELLEIRNTILNLVDALVEQGVLTAEKAQALKREASEKAKEQAREADLAEAPVEEPPQEEAAQGVIRVPYVPEFVKEEIRADVRSKLRGEVVEDVMRQAKTERWGMPEALPDWTRTFSFDGDIRLRAQGDSFSSDNSALSHFDFQAVNDAGGIDFVDRDQYLNSTEDRERARLRLRLGIEAQVLNDLTAGVRLATGSVGSPVSTNQTLDNDFGSYDLVLDRAYLKRTERNADNYPWLSVWGGRLPNPFLSTDLVWDSDLNFDGAAATFRYNLAGGEDLFALVQRDRTLFATLGAFSLDEVELSSDDKWLLGAQLGADLTFEDQSQLRVGLSYYDYRNITGRINPPNQEIYDFTAPGFLQKGNSLFDISNDFDGAQPVPWRRFALASDYDLVNLTAQYRITKYAPVNIIITGDYVRNVGYDADEIRDRINGRNLFVNSTLRPGDPEEDQVEGYHAKVAIGWPEVSQRRSWQVSFGYKYLERDAVLDAFTDSDFHLGGTNAKGFILGGKYGLLENTYVNARYLSADEIDGPPLGIDVLQIDLVSEF